MGLDMYLNAKLFVHDWNDTGKYDKMKDEISATTGIKLDPKYVEFEAAYWRKANAIHQWFVTNVQSGEDECKQHYVGREDLQILFDTVCKCLANKEQGPDTLPPQGGFFFGSTDIDKDYWEDLEDTRKQLKALLEDKTLKNCDFYYQSSW